MVEFSCPWCEEDGLLALAGVSQPEVSFTCAECGTTVAFVEEPTETLVPAA